MNQKNAQNIGRQDGRLTQIHTPFASKEEYLAHGRQVANFNTRYFKTADLYVEGWTEAWVEPTPPPAPKVHNPNTRFCDCPTCMGEAQSPSTP